MKHLSRKETRAMYKLFDGIKTYPKFRYLLHCRVDAELYLKKLAREFV